LQAQVIYSKVHLDRVKILFAKNATFKDDLDEAQSDYDGKSQLLAADQAQLIQTEWSLQQKTMYAPYGGYVFDTFYRVGEKVAAVHPVLAILSPDNIRALFYIPETLLNQIKLGQTITFSCDSCNGKTSATIMYISPQAEYTPPVIYSKDTRYKLVYLIRASMPANIAQNFHPGQPIDVYLNP
jgi:HlyD family secretion protein